MKLPSVRIVVILIAFITYLLWVCCSHISRVKKNRDTWQDEKIGDKPSIIISKGKASGLAVGDLMLQLQW